MSSPRGQMRPPDHRVDPQETCLLYRFRMTRAFLIGFVLLATACSSHKSFESLCANQVSPPMGCNTSCDPAAGASSCPIGFHCSDKGKCDTFCTLGRSEEPTPELQ